MALTNLLPSNNPSFYNLALFICHLFIDANFRNAHIIYESNAFDHQILKELDTNCPVTIPLYTTDISHPYELPWNPSKKTDNTLQIIFLESNQSLINMTILRESFVFYRVFVFPLSENDWKTPYETIKELNLGYNSSTIVLYHNLRNDSIFIDWMPINDDDNDDVENQQLVNILPALISSKNDKIKRMKRKKSNMYDETFGKYDGKRSISINLLVFEVDDDEDEEESDTKAKYVFIRSAESHRIFIEFHLLLSSGVRNIIQLLLL